MENPSLMNEFVDVRFTVPELEVLCDLIRTKTDFYCVLNNKLHRRYDSKMSDIAKRHTEINCE